MTAPIWLASGKYLMSLVTPRHTFEKMKLENSNILRWKLPLTVGFQMYTNLHISYKISTPTSTALVT